MNSLFIFSATVLFMVATASGEPEEDKQALIDFINNIDHSPKVDWELRNPVCTGWVGVTCNRDNSRVIALRLPGTSLRGSIPPNTIGRLAHLQVLSLRSNGLSGSFPGDVLKLRNLTAIYLQSNRFSGPLASDLSAWKSLTILNLSRNRFNGSVPPAVSNLTQLVYLNLANNSFSGEIPDLDLRSLRHLNLANNSLTGIIPQSLRRFPRSAFAGNRLSYGNDNHLPPPAPQPAGGRRKTAKLSEPAILGIALGACVILFVLVALLIIFCYRKRGGTVDSQAMASRRKSETSSKKKEPDTNHVGENNKLTFFEGSNLAFDLEDLLTASAEVLGKGTFGTSYKASLENSTSAVVVVKRLKEVNVPRRDFQQQMEVIGKIRHENVLPLRAYFCSKDEKLMVYDYLAQGSVFMMMHGRRGDPGRNPLDWETRLRIAVGAARGMAAIHERRLVHGNVKSSNIFLNSKGYGCLSEASLAALASPMPLRVGHKPGYIAPEVSDLRKSTPASDVYSFGVLLLELVTGKSPTRATEEVGSIVVWVNSVVKEEWTGELFDTEIPRSQEIEEEMVEMLTLGMNCTVKVPERRPQTTELVKAVEQIRQSRSSAASEIRSGASSNSAPTPV